MSSKGRTGDPRDERVAALRAGRERPGRGRPAPLRASATRPADARPRSCEVLRDIEASGADGGVAELARQATEGDDLAFAELYVRFFDPVHRYLSVALKSRDDAQEVAQDVFARALGALERFDAERGEFRDWLFRMVRNVAIDHLRKWSHADEVELREARSQAMPVAERAASLLERLDPDAGVRALIDELPETQRRVLALRFVFGLDTAEIADAMDSTPDAIRHVQHRGLKVLSACVERGAPTAT